MRLNRNKGITLVALVVTIIILLILAGISISALTQTGIFGKAKQAEQKSKEAQEQENATLGTYENEIDKYLEKNNGNDEDKTKEKFTGKTVEEAIKYGNTLNATDNTELKDAKGNKIVVPAGFKIVSDDTTSNAQTVDKGIVVEDATVDDKGNPTATNGSQFVWIPVGKITKADGTTTTINLDRYTFDENGKETAQGEKVIETYYQEQETSDKGNAVAKSITDFKSSVTVNGGYYIGRYEARTRTARNSETDILTQVTEKGTDQVYNYVTQQQAANQTQDMYDNTHLFTSDLMNSYAWDTAILFIQNCTNQTKYSIQKSLNRGSLEKTGTTYDVQCNIFDMASNVYEWITETSSNSDASCVRRGGDYYNNYSCTSVRYNSSADFSNINIGFRPLLYVNV